jgi:hypothetical protein
MICDYPEIAARLRVCWQGPQTGANCGRCEKCVRTKLNFAANRQPPLCFDDQLTHAQILGIRAQNPLQLAYLREILSSARKDGVRGAWTRSLALAIAKNRLLAPAWRLQRTVADKLRRPSAPPAAAGGTRFGVEEK